MDKTPHIVWGTVAAVVAIMLLAIPIVQIRSNYQFDRACVENGKSIIWSTKQGADSALKECK